MQSAISRRDMIIFTAIEIIDELGVQGLSTKEIALRQEIAESALYRHFKSKDQIVTSIIEYFRCFDESIYRTVLEKKDNCEDKILAFINAYIEYYENYPAITSILHSFEILSHGPGNGDKVKQIFDSRLHNLAHIIETGQEEREISDKYTASELACIIQGFCNTVILQWRLENCSISLKEMIFPTLEKILSKT